MDLEKANKAIKVAWVAGVISGIITLIAALTGFAGFNMGHIVDVALICVLTIGIARRSRIAVVMMLIYFIASKILLWFEGKGLSGIGIFGAILFGYFFFQGIRGTFAYRKIINSSDGINSLRLSKGFYISSFWLSVALGIASLFTGLIYISETESFENGFGFIGVAFIMAIYGVVNLSSLYCKMWRIIQDGHAHTSPGKAVGFLFIPFFNIYWLVPAFCGFSRDYNSFIRRHAVPRKMMPEWLFVIFVISILIILASSVGLVVPGLAGLSIFTALTGTVVFLVVNTALISTVCNAINAVRTHLQTIPSNSYKIDSIPDSSVAIEIRNQQITDNQDESCAPKIDLCLNCGRKIGRLEHVFLFKGNKVCYECFKKLNDPTQ